MNIDTSNLKPGDYIQTWDEVARYEVVLRVRDLDLAVGAKHRTLAAAENEARAVQRLVDREDWGALTLRVLDHAGRVVGIDDTDIPITRIRECEEGLLSGHAYEDAKAGLRTRGLALESDDRGMRVVARYNAARTYTLLREAMNADDDELIATCRKAFDGSPSAIDAVWLALEEAGALDV